MCGKTVPAPIHTKRKDALKLGCPIMYKFSTTLCFKLCVDCYPKKREGLLADNIGDKFYLDRYDKLYKEALNLSPSRNERVEAVLNHKRDDLKKLLRNIKVDLDSVDLRVTAVFVNKLDNLAISLAGDLVDVELMSEERVDTLYRKYSDKLNTINRIRLQIGDLLGRVMGL
jgi:hypothetical protein